MINIIVNDLSITTKEITQLLTEMSSTKKYNASDIFCYPVRTSKKRKQMIRHSTFITARNKNNKIVGLVRIIGDSTYEYYISEVMVIPAMQGKGIGTKLMKASLKYCKKNGFMQIFLSSAENRESFYSRFGFKPCKLTVMKIKSQKLIERK